MANMIASRAESLSPRSMYPSLFEPTFTSEAAPHNLALSQRCRRSIILAKTRGLIDRNAMIENVTVRAIASECGVAVQTLYNLFGSRTRILELAITDEMMWMARHAQNLDGYPNPVLAFSDVNCDYIASWPGFMRNTALACAPSSGGFYAKIRKSNNECIMLLLEAMRQRGMLLEEANIPALASLLNVVSQMTPLDWAGGYCSLHELRFEVAARNVCALSNAVSIEQRNRMQEWLQELRRDL